MCGVTGALMILTLIQGGLYTPIGHVTSGKTYSLVGVVVEIGETKTTRTGGERIILSFRID
jgi:hypothetical protein